MSTASTSKTVSVSETQLIDPGHELIAMGQATPETMVVTITIKRTTVVDSTETEWNTQTYVVPIAGSVTLTST